LLISHEQGFTPSVYAPKQLPMAAFENLPLNDVHV
jgi:hypothetical protein